MTFWIHLAENAPFYLITLLTLLVWDITDLYIELKNFRFLWRWPFLAYYGVVAFFSIATMEAGFLLNVYSTQSRYLVAFLIPLTFSIVLQNLVVKIGGSSKTVDLSEFFDKFRFTIRDNLDTIDAMNKIRKQTQLLNSEITSEEILEWCRFYYNDDEIKTIKEKTEKMETRDRKIEIIKFLLVKAPDAAIIQILERCGRTTTSKKEKA